MSMYAVKNDNGEFAFCEIGKQHGETGFGTIWTELNKPYAQLTADDTDGHVVELIEKPAPVVVSTAEAEILERAKKKDAPAWIIYSNSVSASEDRLMRAYVNGWTVEKPKRWNVKVPHTKKAWYYQYGDTDLLTIFPADKELRGKFTESEIEHYGLQDCEKEEVTE